MRRVLGYVLALLGIVFLASKNLPQIQTYFPYITQIPQNVILVVGGALIILGIFMIIGWRRGHAPGREVPIYHRNRVVGYRKG